MFTGLVRSLGTVSQTAPDGSGGLRLTVRDPMAKSVQLGDSIAVNGCCLTVVTFDAESMTFQLGPETLAKTTFGTMIPGTAVNLEPALRVGDAVGGHFVSGHVDALGAIRSIETNGDWTTFTFTVPESADELLVTKGSIAIDGISLTVVSTEPGSLSVMVIPHTRAVTTLGCKSVGDAVHLEFDLLAKHVQKLFQKLTLTV
jgi:riboflavin synthase